MRRLIVAIAVTCVAPACAATTLHVKEKPTLAADAVQAPRFTGTDHRGAAVSLHDALAQGPVVLVFYRGHW